MTGIDYGSQQYPQAYTMQYDANGRLGGLLTNGTAMMTASYGVAGEMLGLSYEWNLGASETRTYNAMLQMTRQTVTGSWYSELGTGTVMDLQYVYPGGANNGRIAQTIDGVGGETVNYTYDALNRLAGAGATNGTWGQAFTYDGFGNLVGKAVTAGSAPVLSVSVDPATNRVVGQAYDANGNAGTGYTYDVENRMIMGTGGTYVYDQAGKRVKKTSYWGSPEYYFYGIGGQKLVTQACTSGGCSAPQYNVYFAGKLVKSKGVLVVTDRLGSVRASALERMSYYPYGEEKTSTGDGREKFGTYTRDNTATDYADQRYYGVGMGRFGTPDPSSPGDPGEPATWNKYAYVVGDPVNLIDRTGLFYSTASLAAKDEDQDQPILSLGPDYFGFSKVKAPKPPSAIDEWDNLTAECRKGLKTAMPGASIESMDMAVNRAVQHWNVLDSAGAANGIDPAMLAAIGVEETGFRNIPQLGGGNGRGFFQIDIGKNPSVTGAQAYDISFAANWAASYLAQNMATLAAKFPTFTPDQLLQATAASYNFGTGNISGNPNTIDVGTTPGNYGGNVLKLMDCFH